MTTLTSATPSPGELQRVEAVRRYQVLDTPREPAFDRIAATAARLFGARAAAVSFVDADRIWVKAHHGLGSVSEFAREPGLCSSTVDQPHPWVVTDALTDPRARDNSMVTALGLRFYAGAPLITPDGLRIGTLCVLDPEPRSATDTELGHLEALALLVVDALELRLEARLTVEREEGLRRQAEELAEALQASLLPPRPPDVPQMELASRYLAGESGLQVGGDFFDVFRLGHNDWGIVLGDVCGKGARPASMAMLARWAIRGASVHEFSPSSVLRDVNSVFARDERIRDDRYCSAVFARLELDTCGAWLTVANAGHPRPILVRASGKVEARTEATIPIGLFDTIEPFDDRVGLGPGDALVFYTDGITEARGARRPETFGEERLLGILTGLTGAPAELMAAGVIRAAAEFSSGSIEDDVAILVVRVPDDAGRDPLGRITAATGLTADRLKLPGYPKDQGLRRR